MRVLSLLSCCLLVSCTGSTGGSSSSSSTSGGSGVSSSGGNASSPAASAGTSAPASSLVSPSSSAQASSAAAPSSSAVSTTSSSGGGATCGGGHFDSWWDNMCGAGQDTTVSCQVPSATCAATGQVCGCDGAVHASECDAQQAGVDLDDRGGCTAPSGKFRCGAHFCTAGKYCIHTGDLAGFPDNFVCSNLPASCNGTADCTCVRFAQCGEESMVGPVGTCVAVTDGVINRCPDARFY